MPTSVTVIDEPTETRPAEPVQPTAPVEPEYEHVGVGITTLMARHTWEANRFDSEGNVSHHAVKHQVGDGLTVSWSDDGTVGTVRILGDHLHRRFSPHPTDGNRPLIKAFTETVVGIAEAVTFHCGDRTLQF
ncbi:MAG: hypothetical protein OXG27_04930 [Chloroflexi bacterium]|nr:hypothetical protein [Chloroflexota bacterium]